MKRRQGGREEIRLDGLRLTMGSKLDHPRAGEYPVGFGFQAEDGIRDYKVTGVQTCALPISLVSIAPGALLWSTPEIDGAIIYGEFGRVWLAAGDPLAPPDEAAALARHFAAFAKKKRSDERRVGKECRSRWSPDH